MPVFRRSPTMKTNRLAKYPALATVPRKTLADIATWADELTIQAGETVAGLGGIDRWSYLVADPAATVAEGGQSRPAGEAIGLVQAIRGRRTGALKLVACEPLELLAIPPTRLTELLEQVPRLIRVAFDQTAPTPTEASTRTLTPTV